MALMRFDSYANDDAYAYNILNGREYRNLGRQVLVDCSIFVGVINGYLPSVAAARFYESIVDMAFDFSGQYIRISGDYANSETSVKSCISFHIGMIAAELLANIYYVSGPLYHLKDNFLNVTFYNNNPRRPDFFGIGPNNQAYLFEAKGTAGNFVSNDTVREAKRQLAAVASVTFNGIINPPVFAAANIRKFVTAMSFDQGNAVISQIDPDEVSPDSYDLVIDADKAMADHYWHVVKLINNSKCKDSIRVGDRVYIGTYMLDKFIGIDADVYAALGEYSLIFQYDTFEGMNITGIYDRVNKVLESINAYTDYISKDNNNSFGGFGQDYYLSRDGVIVKSMNNNDAQYGA
ncbi:MAG: hypothetical protein K6D38_07760 [Pseudobutyrivibrio sp.]|nr:hypothetical protein [Pseudobutyrivibrio sp.]